MVKVIRQCQHVILFLFKSTIITTPIEIYFLSGNYLFKVNTRNTKESSDMFSDVFSDVFRNRQKGAGLGVGIESKRV